MPIKDHAKRKEYYRERHLRNKEAFNSFKNRPCFDCGKTFPHYVMELDHVPERGKKKRNVACITGSRSLSAPTLLIELEKCDVVCANCHNTRGYFRQLLGGKHE